MPAMKTESNECMQTVVKCGPKRVINCSLLLLDVWSVECPKMPVFGLRSGSDLYQLQ